MIWSRRLPVTAEDTISKMVYLLYDHNILLSPIAFLKMSSLCMIHITMALNISFLLKSPIILVLQFCSIMPNSFVYNYKYTYY